MNRDACVRYIDKSRDYYAAHGYEVPYRWAKYDTIPFAPLNKPLSECRVSVVTTAMPDASYVKKNRRLAVGDLHNPPAGLFTGDLSWDKEATHTDDRESYLPINALNNALQKGAIGSLGRHFYCAPTNYSARATVEQDAPAIVQDCIDDAVDVVLLVPL